MREKYSTHRSGTYLSIWHTKTSNTNFCNLVLRLLKPVHLYVSNRRFFSLGYHQFLFRLHTINDPFIRFINNKKILWQTIQCDDLYAYSVCYAPLSFFSHIALCFFISFWEIFALTITWFWKGMKEVQWQHNN